MNQSVLCSCYYLEKGTAVVIEEEKLNSNLSQYLVQVEIAISVGRN